MSKKIWLILAVILLVPFAVLAKINNYSFSSDSGYTYDNTKIEFSGSTARLKATSSWMDTSWTWREAVTVTNPTIYTTTANTETKITITSANTDFWAHIESDGDSIRFTSSDGVTSLNYYLESYSYAGQTATIWVKVPSIARETTATIYLYFGNTAAVSASSADGVFLFDEAFTGSTIDTVTKYTLLDHTPAVVWSQNGTQLVGATHEAGGGTDWHGIYAQSAYGVSPTTGIVFETDFSTTNETNGANKDQNLFIGLKNTSTETNGLFWLSYQYAMYINGGYSAGCTGYSISYRSNSTATTYTDSTLDMGCNTTYTLRIVVYPSNGADYFIKGGTWTDWTYFGHSTYSYTDPLVPAISKQEGQATIDNVRIRRSTVTATSDGLSLPRGVTPTAPVFQGVSGTGWENANGLGESTVLYEDGIFKMWYSSAVSATSAAIGYATSTDGVTWNRYASNPVFSPSGVNGAFDKSLAFRSEIVKSNGIYYMYYNGFEVNDSGAGAIGLATSTDGITWNRNVGNPILSIGSGWENGSLYNTSVVIVGGTWYMLYEARGTGSNILGLATSSDGITWTKYGSNPVLATSFQGLGYVAAPALVYDSGVFYIWYLGNAGDGTYYTGRAYSTDAITWTHYSVKDMSNSNPNGTSQWEWISVSDFSNPIEVNGSVYAYYTAGNQSTVAAVGLIKYTGTLHSFVTNSTPLKFGQTYEEITETQAAAVSLYSTASPTLVGSSVTADTLSAFAATASSTTSVTFQLSNDATTWYYWNGSVWVAGTTSAQSNSATDINSHISTFTHPSGTVYWRAYFASDGSLAQQTALSAVSITTNSYPTVTIDSISGWKTGLVTVTYKLIDYESDTSNFTQTDTSGIEYSIDGGSTWADATDGGGASEGLTSLAATPSPGTSHTFVWNSTADVPTGESATVYLRFRPNDGTANATGWTSSAVFGVDNVAPSAVGAPTFGAISSAAINVVKPTVVTEGGSGLAQWQVRVNGGTPQDAISTGTGSLTISSGLATNAQYTFDVRFLDTMGNVSGYGTSAAKYTLAANPVAPTVAAVSATSLSVAIGSDGNNSAVTYSILETGTGNYVQADGTLGVTEAKQTATTWGTKTVSGLSPNTSYSFKAQAYNGDGTAATLSSATAKYTWASIPTAVAAVADTSEQISVTWSGDATQYYVENITAGTNSGWQTAKTKSFGGLMCYSAYTFKIKGRNAEQVVTDWSASVSMVSGGCGLGSSFAKQLLTTPVVSVPSAIVSLTTPVVSIPAVSPVPAVTSSTIPAPILVEMPKISASSTLPIVTPKPVIIPVTPMATTTVGAPTLSVQPGAAFKMMISFKNKSPKALPVKVVSQLVNPKGKVLKMAAIKQTVKAGAELSSVVNKIISKTTPPGDYDIKIKIVNSQSGQIIYENSFNLTVEKLKSKYFVSESNIFANSDIIFDVGVLNKIKTNVKLPTTVKLKFSYTNNTDKPHTIKMVRELVGANGQILNVKTGKWTMKVGEKDDLIFSQTIPANLIVGTYLIRIRASDWTTKELLAENSVGFGVEEK